MSTTDFATTTTNPTVGIAAATPTDLAPSRPHVWLLGLVSGAVAAVVTEGFAQVVHAAGVPLRAGNIGGHTAEAIPFGGFATMTMGWCIVGTLLAFILARKAANPARVFTITTVTLTVVSFVAPALAGATTTGTKLLLCSAHVVAAAIFVVPMARRLSTRP